MNEQTRILESLSDDDPPGVPLLVRRLGRTHSYREPVELLVQQSADGFVVEDRLIDRSGEGPTLAEALEDYAEVVLDYLTTLSAERDRLAERPARHLQVLQQLVVEG